MTSTPEAFMAAPKKRKNHLRTVAFAVAGTLLLGGIGGVVGTTIAGQTVKSTVSGNTGEARSASIVLGTSPMAFDVTPGYSTTKTFTVRNDGGVALDYILAATSFNGFEAQNHPAYNDTQVTITDITEGAVGSAEQYGLKWQGTLAQFRDTAVGGSAGVETPLAPNEVRTFSITMATPFDVDADAWDAAKSSGSSNAAVGHAQGFSFDYTAIGTQIRPTDSGSAWRDAATYNPSMAAWELPASALRAALSVTLNGNNLDGPFVAGVNASGSSDVDIDPARNAPAEAVKERLFRDAAARSLGSVWVDANGNLVGDGDADGDGIHYDADGIRQFG